MQRLAYVVSQNKEKSRKMDMKRFQFLESAFVAIV